MGPALSVLVIPGILWQLEYVVSEIIGCGRTGPDSIFPLCLGWQAVWRTTFLRIQPLNELLHIIPGDFLYREVRIVSETAGITPHHCLPLALCHLILTQTEGPTDADFVDWGFIGVAF